MLSSSLATSTTHIPHGHGHIYFLLIWKIDCERIELITLIFSYDSTWNVPTGTEYQYCRTIRLNYKNEKMKEWKRHRLTYTIQTQIFIYKDKYIPVLPANVKPRGNRLEISTLVLANAQPHIESERACVFKTWWRWYLHRKTHAWGVRGREAQRWNSLSSRRRRQSFQSTVFFCSASSEQQPYRVEHTLSF